MGPKQSLSIVPPDGGVGSNGFSSAGRRGRRRHGGPGQQQRRHALERRFVCFSLVSIAAFISYAALHLHPIIDGDVSSSSRGGERRNEYWYEGGGGIAPAETMSRRRNDGGIDIGNAAVGRRADWKERGGRDAGMTGKWEGGGGLSPSEKDSDEDLIVIPSVFVPVDERRLHDGRVVEELSRRVLSRNIAQSNVVIVSPDFGNEAQVVSDNVNNNVNKNGNIHDSIKDVAGKRCRPARVSMEQGHTTHLLPPSTNLSKYDSVGWILLAYFSTQKAAEGRPAAATIDDVLSPSRAGSWLRRTTITYLVFPVSARATVPISSIVGHDYEYEADCTADMRVEATGLTAARTLLDSDYKLQLLASSHHFDDDEATTGEDDEGAYRYGPNSLFTSAKALHRFLHDRASRALRAEARNILRHWQRRGHSIMDRERTLEVEFHSLLFATQGLDLAIPSRFSYTDVGNHKECAGQGGRRKGRCDPKLNARAMNDAILLKCPARHDALKIQFVNESDIESVELAGFKPWMANKNAIQRNRVDKRTLLEKSHGIAVDIDGGWMKDADEESGEVEVWTGDEVPDQSEAACVKANSNAILPIVACRTRIIPTNATTVARGANDQQSRRPNLLVVMIDPLSKEQLKRSLPNTGALLKLLGFVDFPHYTAVGDNSGPNQAALYSGTPLEGRQSIRHSKNSTRTWLWDRLNAAGYVTMKAENGCISNSNMVQSIKPRTHHGSQLHEMFCFSYDRPNCLGGRMTAEYLADYARQFIDAYSRGDEGASAEGKPWAAFLSFIDSHEDTLTLISYLDDILLNFIQDVPMKDTVVLFTSDHGLHYGPAFGSKSGERERAQPVLHVRLPSFRRQGLKILQQNANYKYTTAFDVHETLLDVLLGRPNNNPPTGDNPLGMSLMKPLPDSRNRCGSTKAIPSKFCSLELDVKDWQCNFMIDPPSVFSFYSDIPQRNRPRWPDRCPVRRNHETSAEGNATVCSCATNRRDWFDCANTTRTAFRGGITLDVEHFSLRSCGSHELDQSLELDIHVRKNEQVAESRRTLAAARAKTLLARGHSESEIKASLDARPNIVFLEIDSVSLSNSERFFPQTWGLLGKHSILTGGGGVSCPTGWCAGVFNKTSVVGQSSIVNQLAALSGCLDHDDQTEKLEHYKDGPQTHCPAGGKNSFGIDEKSGVKRDHWIFDVAKNLGYITFFGEEFCYEDSPYVVQTQSAFTLDVDLTLDKLFCHLAKDWLKVKGKANSQQKTWSVEYDGKEVPDTCFDGKSRGEIGLEYISQMWDAYDSSPKFAFLNALAAHDYSLDAAHSSLGSENYDRTVYNFLNNLMAKSDARDTYIVLRSDHGLQGGPYPIDYATQIEHMHPWTAIIAPANHLSLSLEPFASNQNSLVTGFDMYHSLRYLMSPSFVDGNGKQKSLLFDSGIPRWSYNLFQQTISLNRNCQDAKIPKSFCPCISERHDMVPSFYVGHSEQSTQKLSLPMLSYNWTTMRFAALRLPGVLLPKNAQIKYVVRFNRDVLPPRCNTTLSSYINEGMLRESWQLIHNITSLFPESDVSGGIFLYPRQMILLVYLVQHQVALRAAENRNPDNSEPFRICETGFGSGHSAALFLSSAPNVEVVTFDKFDRPYQSAAFVALQSSYGKRLTRVIGNSCQTVKSYKKTCHFLHGSSLCKTDNIDLIHKSGAGVTLTSTAMGSLDSGAVYFGKKAQWAFLRKEGCIENVVCFAEEERTLDGKFIFSSGKGQKISHKFCFAVNTGACKKSKGVESVKRTWREDDFCPNWIVHAPGP